MLKILGDGFSGIFFLGGLSKILPDETSSIVKLFSLGGILVTSLLKIAKEYKAFHYQEARKYWLRPMRIFTPVLKSVVVIAFITSEIFKIQNTEEDDNFYFRQGCYVGFAFSMLMDCKASWEIVKRRGESIDKWDALFSLLSSGALFSASAGMLPGLKSMPDIENISLITAGGICIFQASARCIKSVRQTNEQDEQDPQASIVEGINVSSRSGSLSEYRAPLLAS